jgi:thioredoxin 2
LVAKATIPVVVDFWAPWCAPCLRFAPTFSEVAGELGGKFVFAKLNTESYPDASAEFGIRGIPTMIAFRGGAEAKRVSGAMAMGQFVSWLGTI